MATSRTLPSGLGSDALERLILLPLSRIGEQERRGERELSTAFHVAHPHTLGALLDLAALALAHYPEAVAAKVKRPRMADYGNVLLALDRGLGLPEDAGHFAAYVSAVNTSQAERALDDPFTRAVLQIVAARGGKWVGTLDAALRELDRYRTRDVEKWWPTNPRALSSQLSKATVPLENAGVTWSVRKSDGTRRLTLVGPSEMPDAEGDDAEPENSARDLTHGPALPF